MLSGIAFISLAPALMAGDKLCLLPGVRGGGVPGGPGPGGISSGETAIEEDPAGGERS